MSTATASRKEFSSAAANAATARKPKKTYDHELTEAEKFGVAAFLQARKAINVLIDHMRSGKSTSATALRAAMALSSEAALTFGSDPKQGEA